MFHAWFGIFIIIAWEESISSFLLREDKIYTRTSPEVLRQSFILMLTDLSHCCTCFLEQPALKCSTEHLWCTHKLWPHVKRLYATHVSTWRKQPMKSQVGAWFCLKCVLSPCAAKRSIWAPHSQLLFYSASFNCLNPFSACFVSESPHRGEHDRQ